MTTENDPRTAHHEDGFEEQEQTQPGLTTEMMPAPDHGEDSYVGSGRLDGLVALITGGDSGIGRAAAIAYAREGADVAIVCLPEEQADGDATGALIEASGRRALVIAADIRDEQTNADIVERVVSELGSLDILVLNAAFQDVTEGIHALETAKFRRTFETNIFAQLWMTRAAVPHLKPGSSIIVTSSVQAVSPSPALIDYAMTKAAQVAFVKGLAQELGEKGIRVNAVAPGPVWTPLIPGTSWPETLPEFGQDTPLGRAGQPAELASSYVFLADPASSFVSGAVVSVTGGTTF
ncbi:SDR family oxidoreductase [Labedella endophytica]|uniref:SDR family oxidoreductase n=1 Tax=Labedella endophytica TaxID=1523160 RepID=A0A3S0XP75_9MICO|nr:SDR family oxidoreductase [Labedella endophytica]RUR01905.1 SDR family oxidoreductase [Labedella endophytica]